MVHHRFPSEDEADNSSSPAIAGRASGPGHIVSRSAVPRPAVSRRGTPTRGSVSLEAMVLVPLFLVALFTIIQGSLWLYATSVAQAAAQDGARVGTVLGGTPTQAHDTADAIVNARSCGENWVVTTQDTGVGLTVTVTGEALRIVPGITINVQESAALPKEQP